jgi:hypothetical protein
MRPSSTSSGSPLRPAGRKHMEESDPVLERMLAAAWDRQLEPIPPKSHSKLLTPMPFDPGKSVAVFLGPSLPLDEARKIVEANFYPPVSMGDVYRLTGSGVRVIVIIDGLFHDTTPVWQREIREALENGIHVVGASSMGALRAVELSEYGMTGCGRIFEWFLDGTIDGDDEVALIHGEASTGFRAFTIPLANMRWILQAAETASIITRSQSEALIRSLKEAGFSQRTPDFLWSTSAARELAASTRARLRDFIGDDAPDLKMLDARIALERARSLALDEPPRPAAPVPSDYRQDAFQDSRARHRGIFHPDGWLIAGARVLAEFERDAVSYQSAPRRMVHHFFLRQWAAHAGVRCPEEARENFLRRWRSQHLAACESDDWLRANGLTRRELDACLEDRALLHWIATEKPCGGEKQCIIAWAVAHGMLDHPNAGKDFEKAYEWLIDSGPAHFGYEYWRLETDLLEELQTTGQAARLVRRVEIPGAAHV